MTEEERQRASIDNENSQRVAQMSDQERKEEARELKERFGPGLEELMRKRRQKRLEQQGAMPASTTGDVGIDHHVPEAGSSSQNTATVQAMSSEERQREIAELEERFGSTVVNALRQRALSKVRPVEGDGVKTKPREL